MAVMLLSAPLAAAAQQPLRCPEGKTRARECINPILGLAGRERGINIVTRKVGGPSASRNMPSSDVLFRDPAWLAYLRNNVYHYGDLYIYRR
jgi:hypothetical protein